MSAGQQEATPNRFIRVAAWVSDHWVETLMSSLPSVMSLASFFVSEEVATLVTNDGEQQRRLQQAAGAVFLVLFVGQFWVIQRFFGKQKKISQILSELETTKSRLLSADRNLEEMRGGVFQDYRQICRNYLRDLGDLLQFESTDRATLYVHRPEGTFIPLERESRNPELRKLRRHCYRDREGCIAQAWRKGHHFEKAPGDAKAWIEWCASQGMRKGLAGEIRMRSRLYFGWRVMDREKKDHLAVLMLESENPGRWTEDSLLDAFRKRQDRILNDVLVAIGPQIPDRQMAADRRM